MFSDSLFALGWAGPLLVLFLLFLVIGLPCSGAAIVVRIEADSEATAGKLQRKIDWAIAILAISGLLPILGGVLVHYGFHGTGMILASFGIFLLWPVSGVLAIRGRGAGRRVLLVGHGLRGHSVGILLLIVLVHGQQSIS